MSPDGVPTNKVEPSRLEEIRLRVADRLAALLESQTRTKIFGGSLIGLIREMHREVIGELQAIKTADPIVAAPVERVLELCGRLDRSVGMLFDERTKQWHRNGAYVQELMREFNSTLTDVAGTLIEKELFERQSAVLEHIILSHEKVTQWKEFVQEILADFHRIFPFNFFFIAFSEEHGLSLFLYYLGDFSDEAKTLARQRLLRQMISDLKLPPETPFDVEEFHVARSHRSETAEEEREDGINMLTVAVPEHTPELAGILGVAYASSGKLSPQEESVVRSILAVMVMVVGSSKVLSRTLAELDHYSTHDPLTGLYNRRHFNAMLDYEVGRSGRHSHEFSILLLDLDDFKDVNDSYGHPTGDSALCGLAEVFGAVLRKGDLATRIGGDEFAIILTETGRSGAARAAAKLGRMLRQKTFSAPDGRIFHITVSIGIVTYPEDGRAIDDLMAGVDIAMYKAKEQGKDGACTLDSVQDRVRTTRATRDYAEKLREALQQQRIVPFYQPIIDCKTGGIFAYETLARLLEPDGDIISAGTFIGAIEKYGLARELDRAILDKAFSAKRERMQAGQTGTKLFINLSAQEIQERGILGYAESLCGLLEIPPACVVFEILEREAIGDMTNMRKFLSNLREKGFAFALDDFGSGYNSFHYLRELHFDYVKIDGAFVRNILTSRIDFALVNNLTRLCRDIGIATIAEFVETAELLSALQEMGVDYAQGMHIAMPLPDMRDMPRAIG